MSSKSAHEHLQGRLRAWQGRITALTYDLPGTAAGAAASGEASQHQVIHRCPTMQAVSTAAVAILGRGAPVRCQEGVVLACYFTAEVPGLLRLPLSFKTRIRATGVEHRHIVLAIREPVGRRQWGSMGISRSPALMDKPLDYPSLSALVRAFAAAYQAAGHDLLTVFIGLPFSSSRACLLPVRWRAVHVECTQESEEEAATATTGWTKLIDSYAGSLSALVAHHARTLGLGVPPPATLLQMLKAKAGPLCMHDLMLLGSPPSPRRRPPPPENKQQQCRQRPPAAG